MFGSAHNDLETFQARRLRLAKEEIARKKCCGDGSEQHVGGRQIGWVMLALNKAPDGGGPRSVLLLPAMVSYEAYQRAIVAVLGSEEAAEEDLPVHEQVRTVPTLVLSATPSALRPPVRCHTPPGRDRQQRARSRTT